MTLIFGENGTGKSTIADAFDFICNRKLGSLENYSLGEPAKKHVPSFGCGSADVKVTLASGGSRGKLHSREIAPRSARWRVAQTPRILRRRNILSLIEAQPKQRFDVLKEFIAVPNIEKCESALRDAVTTTNTSSLRLSRTIAQAREDLAKLWRQRTGRVRLLVFGRPPKPRKTYRSYRRPWPRSINFYRYTRQSKLP